MTNNKIHHGKITEALAMVDKSNVKVDRITGVAEYVSDGVTINLPPKAAVKVITHKLLMFAIMKFTFLNGNKTISHQAITFTVKEFLKKCGINVDNKPSVDKGRAEIKKSLSVLKGIKVTIREGEDKYLFNDADLKLIDAKSGVKNGMVYMYFTDAFAKYLITRPIAEYPSSLFRCDGKKHNAYRLGYKIALHTTNKNNQIKGTANTLKVMTVVKNVCLPNHMDLQKTRQSWAHKIKNKIDDILSYLIEIGCLKNWHYRTDTNETYNSYIQNYIEYECDCDKLLPLV